MSPPIVLSVYAKPLSDVTGVWARVEIMLQGSSDLYVALLVSSTGLRTLENCATETEMYIFVG
jgi:hypothetical protein